MTAEHYKASIQRLYAALNRGDDTVVDELFAPDLQDHASHGTSTGLEAFKQFSALAGAAFPDMQFQVEDVFGEDERVVARGRLTGTQTGPWMGQPATNRPIDIGWMAIYRFAEGLIVERWLIGDDLAMMRQLAPPSA